MMNVQHKPSQQESSSQKESSSQQNVLETALYWDGTLLSLKRLARDGELTLGDAPDVDFEVSDPALLHPQIALVSRRGNEGWVYPSPGMRLTVNGELVDAPRRLHGNEKAVASVGALEFRIAWSSPSAPILVPLFASLDFLYSKVLAAALILQVGLVVGVMLTPEFAPDDDANLVERAADWAATVQSRTLTAAPLQKSERSAPAIEAAKSAPRFGQKLAAAHPAAGQKRARSSAIDDARRAMAMLGFTANQPVGGDSVLGNLAASIGQLRGANLGGADNLRLGTRGIGPAGGGNTIGIGRVGPASQVGGDEFSLCGGARCKKKRHAIVQSTEKTRVLGAMKRGEIQRVVNRHLSRIRACYEGELGRHPSLQGKLTPAFVIAASGKVATSKIVDDTMGSANVSRCVNRVVRGMSFPKPRGGGIVSVRYPFVFSN